MVVSQTMLSMILLLMEGEEQDVALQAGLIPPAGHPIAGTISSEIVFYGFSNQHLYVLTLELASSAKRPWQHTRSAHGV